jgi:hypothetical protein
MSAATADATPTLPDAPATTAPGAQPPVLAAAPQPEVFHRAEEEAQLQAESVFWRAVIVGILLGMLVCAGIWAGLVAIATVNNGTNMAANLGMAAGCGAFAGVFLGGCAGAMLGSRALAHAEHDELPAAPHA